MKDELKKKEMEYDNKDIVENVLSFSAYLYRKCKRAKCKDEYSVLIQNMTLTEYLIAI